MGDFCKGGATRECRPMWGTMSRSLLEPAGYIGGTTIILCRSISITWMEIRFPVLCPFTNTPNDYCVI